MDRVIEARTRAARRLRRAIPVAGAVMTAALALPLVAAWVQPSLPHSAIRTAVVERGAVEATVTAGGRVVPEHEEVITSPIDSRVEEIVLAQGAPVAAGEAIVRLDTARTESEVEKLDDQIALKRSERRRAVLEGERERAALRTRREIKALELASREFEAARAREFSSQGLFSRDDVRLAESAEARARHELREIDEHLANLADTLPAKLEGLGLEIAILKRDRREAARRLERAAASSHHDGVLTWVVPREGAAVRRGDELARVADLSAFRVEASVSDLHASRLAVGQEVVVDAPGHRLRGRVERVRPTVEDGVVTLEVTLEERSHPALRHNLRVDVFVVTAREDEALRVKRGTFLMPDGSQAAFAIRGDRAVRTPIRLGITSVDFYQILDGLEAGDEVIVSDMSDYMHLKEVRLR